MAQNMLLLCSAGGVLQVLYQDSYVDVHVHAHVDAQFNLINEHGKVCDIMVI